jgi:DNA-binding response OmpR family regulator
MVSILVAEDDVAVRTFVLRALTHHGYAVTAVPDGVAALEALESRDFDLLITDIVMPRLDGVGLALRVAKLYPELPVLMMTGYSSESQRAHKLDELICDVLVKPFSLRQVCDAADSALGQAQPGR